MITGLPAFAGNDAELASLQQPRQCEALVGRLLERARLAGVQKPARRDVIGRAVDRIDRDEPLAAEIEHRPAVGRVGEGSEDGKDLARLVEYGKLVALDYGEAAADLL